MFLDLNNPEQAHIDQRLRSDIIVWLNTVRPNGSPHSVAVWFGWDGETFLIFSKPHNQKLRNIAHNPRVVLALDDTKDGEDVIAIEGTAELLPQKTVEIMDQSYMEKYAARMKGIGWTVAESMAAEYSEVIRITPVKFIS